jgi:hypothetical protein
MRRADKIAERVAASATSSDASKAYENSRKTTDWLIGNLQVAVKRHGQSQRREPDNYGYVGDLGHVNSELNILIRQLGVTPHVRTGG